MGPQRRPAWSPFFNDECAVVAHSRPTLGINSRATTTMPRFWSSVVEHLRQPVRPANTALLVVACITAAPSVFFLISVLFMGPASNGYGPLSALAFELLFLIACTTRRPQRALPIVLNLSISLHMVVLLYLIFALVSLWKSESQGTMSIVATSFGLMAFIPVALQLLALVSRRSPWASPSFPDTSKT